MVTFYSENQICSYFFQLTTDGYTGAVNTKPTGWIHLAIVFRGANSGVSIYYDGAILHTRNTPGSANNRPLSSERMVICRQKYNYDGKYVTIEIDDRLWDN